MDRLLDQAVTCRLHLAMVMVGRQKMQVDVVLDLRWSQVDLERGILLTDAGVLPVPMPVSELFVWHAAHQRLDALRTARWPVTDRVFVNRYGALITMDQADAMVATCCQRADLPVIPLSGLRHPSWAA